MSLTQIYLLSYFFLGVSRMVQTTEESSQYCRGPRLFLAKYEERSMSTEIRTTRNPEYSSSKSETVRESTNALTSTRDDLIE